MVWCFVKGFAYTIGGTIAFVLFILSNYKFGQWLIYEYDLDEDKVILSILVFWTLVVIGTIVSLAICGVLK